MTRFNVKINGKDILLENVLTVNEMLEARNVSGSMFVVEKNHEIVPKELYSQTSVEDDDSFEIVGFFGGG